LIKRWTKANILLLSPDPPDKGTIFAFGPRKSKRDRKIAAGNTFDKYGKF